MLKINKIDKKGVNKGAWRSRGCKIVYLVEINTFRWSQKAPRIQSTFNNNFKKLAFLRSSFCCILAEGAIALLVTLSGSALFASWKLLQFPSRLIVKVIRAIFKRASAQCIWLYLPSPYFYYFLLFFVIFQKISISIILASSYLLAGQAMTRTPAPSSPLSPFVPLGLT